MARRQQSQPTKPFDATTKSLVETNPLDWVHFLGLPATQCRLVNADLSTVTTEADTVVLVEQPGLFAVHQEFQASWDGTLSARMLRYNVLTDEKLGVPVHSVAVLLRRDADPLGRITGRVERRTPTGGTYLTFEFQTIRLWEVPVETLLTGGLTTLPLAPIADLSGTTPEAVVRRMETRIESEAPGQAARSLWTATYILAGLKYRADDIERLLGRVGQMKESVTYQKILEEGRTTGLLLGLEQGRAQGIEQGREQGIEQGLILGEAKLLLRFGAKRLGEPSEEMKRRVRAIQSQEQLEAIADRLSTVESWDELFSETPS